MSLDRNRMHEMLDEMGALVVDELGPQRIFKVETVQANPLQVSRVVGGTVDAYPREGRRDHARAPVATAAISSQEKVDVVVYGIPDWSPYARVLAS